MVNSIMAFICMLIQVESTYEGESEHFVQCGWILLSVCAPVEQAVSFIDHLMIVQHEQRYAAYCVSEQLQNLRCQFRNIGGREMGDNCILSPNQHTVIKFMWQQKSLFDNLLAMSKDTQLFLQKVENCHKNSCVVKADVDIVSVILEKAYSSILQSKANLDTYLIDSSNTVTMSVKCMPLVASQQMEQLLALNFQVIQNFGEDINTLRLQKECRSAVRESVLERLENLVIKDWWKWYGLAKQSKVN